MVFLNNNKIIAQDEESLTYDISILVDEIQFAVPVKNKNVFKTTELLSYEIIDKLNSFARVKLVFTYETETIVKTRKFYEFKTALEYILNQTHQSLNDDNPTYTGK